MNVLALDTAGRHISLALYTEKGLVLEHNESVDDTISSRLPKILKELVQPWLEDFSTLDVLGVCIGPGPFTGIRLGLTVVKALQLQYGFSFCPVNSLMAHAFPFLGIRGEVVTILDAKRQECYGAGFELGLTGTILPTLPTRLYTQEELVMILKERAPRPVVVGLLPPMMMDLLKSAGLTVIKREPFVGRQVAEITRSRQLEWQKDTQGLLPLYLREPDAVIKQPSCPT